MAPQAGDRLPASSPLVGVSTIHPCPRSKRHCTVVTEQFRLFRDDRLVGLGVLWYPTVGLPHARREFLCDWELSMSKPNTRRTVVRAVRIATGTGGICLLLSLPATQAYAATGDQPSPISGLTSTVSGVVQAATDPVTGALGAIANSVTEPVTSTTRSAASTAQATGQSSAPSSQTATASASPSEQPTAPSGGQASPTAPMPTATAPATSPTGGATRTASATPTLSRNAQPPAPIGSAAAPTASTTAPAVDSTLHTSASGTRTAKPVSSRPAGAPVPVTTEPTPAATPTPRQSRRPTADIASPLSGMPGWLVDVLFATGLLAASAFATEPVIVLARRRRQRGHRSAK